LIKTEVSAQMHEIPSFTFEFQVSDTENVPSAGATKSRFALAMMAFLAGGKLKEGLDKWREVGISEEVIEGVLGAHTAQLPQPPR